MKTLGMFLALSMVVTLPLSAQDSFPRAEVFAGYSFLHDGVTGQNLNGWGASLSGSLTKHLGATADFSGAYGSVPYQYVCTLPVPPGCPAPPQVLNDYHFLAGPRFTLRTPKVTPFAEALFGIANLRRQDLGSRTSFAMGFGGGVDIALKRHFAYRLIQVDYIPTKRPATGTGGGWDSEVRIQTGLVLRFGKGK